MRYLYSFPYPLVCTCVLSRWKFLKGSQSQFCQTYIWNTAVKCPLSEAVGDIYNFHSTLPTSTEEECDIPTCILMDIWMKRGKVFPSLKTQGFLFGLDSIYFVKPFSSNNWGPIQFQKLFKHRKICKWQLENNLQKWNFQGHPFWYKAWLN